MKKLYEGASVLTAVFFVLMVAVGFFFKTKQVREKTKERNHYEKKIEKQEREYLLYEKELIENNKKENEEDLRVIEGWEDYYRHLIKYNKNKHHFDRGNELDFPPPRKDKESN